MNIIEKYKYIYRHLQRKGQQLYFNDYYVFKIKFVFSVFQQKQQYLNFTKEFPNNSF